MPRKNGQAEVRKRIEVEPDQQSIQKLCLDQIEIVKINMNIKRLLQSCVNLQYLTINSCQLLCLQFFPSLPNLISLQMTDNQLKGQDLMKLSLCRQVSFISLSNNNIENISYLNSLIQLKQLEIIIVINNPLVQSNNYRQQIFLSLPQLKTIDCYDREDNLLDSQGDDSYITNKYRSFKSLDDLPYEKDYIKSQKEMLELVEQQNSKSVKRQRQRGHNDSDESSQDQMILEFKRKINKQN